MIIRRIEVKNFRKLVGPVVISGMQPGINVIAGDNEEGKSTLLTALRSAFFLKHTTTGQSVENLVPYGSNVRPEVMVEFDLDSGSYSVLKTFCTKPFIARLKTPGGVVEGAAVEEKLQELLMYPSAGTKKAGEPDRGFWGLLWLEQAAAISGLTMSDSGRQTLIKAVESDIGTVLGGKNGRALMAAVTRLYSDHFTPTRGDAAKEYRKARENFEDCSRELDACRAASREYERKVDDLTQKRDQMAKFKRENTLVQAKDKVQAATTVAEKLSIAQTEFDACVQAEKTLRAEMNTVKQQWETRTQLRVDAEKCVREREMAAKLEQQTQADLLVAREKFDKAQCDLEQIQKDLKESERVRTELQLAEKYQRLETRRSDMSKRLIQAREAQIKLDQAVTEYKKNKLDEKSLPMLRSLQRSVADADARATAASTRIVIHPAAGKSASVMGEELEVGSTLLLSETTTIDLADWGAIDVHPGGENVAAKRIEAEKLRAQLQGHLRAAEVSTIEEAEEQVQRKQQLKGEGELLAKELKLLVPSGIKALEAEIKQVEQELSAHSGSPQSDTNLAEDLAKVSRSIEDLRKQEASEQKNSGEYSKAAHQIELTLREWSSRLASLKQQWESIEARVEKLAVHESDESLKQRLDDALHKCSVKEKETELVKAKLDALNPARIKQDLEDAQKALKVVVLQLENLERNIDVLAAEIDTLSKQGPGERLQEYEGKTEKAKQQFDSIERKARAIKLLHDTMKQCEQEAKDQFMEPVQLRLRPYLNVVFPGTDVTLDRNQFEIEGLQRNTIVEKYNSLSIGTREQISVLTRLAIAGLLKEKGYPATVILDDALVYSDERRFNLMKDVLKRAADEGKMQIVILTCRKKDYLDLDSSLFELAECALDPVPARR